MNEKEWENALKIEDRICVKCKKIFSVSAIRSTRECDECYLERIKWLYVERIREILKKSSDDEKQKENFMKSSFEYVESLLVVIDELVKEKNERGTK